MYLYEAHLPVRNTEASKEFYVDVVGLAPLRPYRSMSAGQDSRPQDGPVVVSATVRPAVTAIL